MSDTLAIMKDCGAFLEGHFLLTSGRHSGGYCQCAQLLRFPGKAAEGPFNCGGSGAQPRDHQILRPGDRRHYRVL